jgi:hypothetical protein
MPLELIAPEVNSIPMIDLHSNKRRSSGNTTLDGKSPISVMGYFLRMQAGVLKEAKLSYRKFTATLHVVVSLWVIRLGLGGFAVI